MQKITPFLWFDTQAAEAARFYVSIFKNSKLYGESYYGEAGKEIHGREPGSVMTVGFELEGQPFTALNGGPTFTFSPAISFVVHCADQAEVDYYWEKLGEGGDPNAQQCGWLKDTFGVSWQIVPDAMFGLLMDSDKEKAGRAMAAMMQMKKIDLEALKRAHDNA